MISADQLIQRVPAMARAALAALVLCGLILAMVIERAAILRNGTTVRLATVPVDPRDLFRGDYVVLSYQIGRINLTRLGVPNDIKSGDTIHVGLKAGSSGLAEVSAVARDGQPLASELVWVKGRAGVSTSCIRGRQGPDCAERDVLLLVRYGLESYFVPEGWGKAIETTASSRVEIVAAVSASGKAAIKSLLIDGKPVYDEPPY